MANSTIKQIYDGNTLAALADTDLFVLTFSPYGAGDDAGMDGAVLKEVIRDTIGATYSDSATIEWTVSDPGNTTSASIVTDSITFVHLLEAPSAGYIGASASGDYGHRAFSTVRADLGLDTTDTPQFDGIEIGDASDTTLNRASAGDLNVEGNIIYRAGGTDVPVADGGTGASTAAAARTNLGLGTGDSPQFTGVEVGAATDTTLTRASAGDLNIEGNIIYRAGGTDVPVTDGGTGSSTAAGAATNLGLGTGDSPEFTAINVGAATDTTVTRASAGDINVEGNIIYRAGGTDVPITDGGTGSSTAAGARTNLGLDEQYALVNSTTTQAITTGVHTQVDFDAEVTDVGGWHDNSTNNTRLTVPSGVDKVQVYGNIGFAANSTGVRSIRFFKNGAAVAGYAFNRYNASTSFFSLLNGSTGILEVTAGDYFELSVFQDSGGNLNVEDDDGTWFAIKAVV